MDDDGQFYYSVDYGEIDDEGKERFMHTPNILPLENVTEIFRTVCVEGKAPAAWEWKEVPRVAK